jgi:hypothetical protein
MNKKVLLFIVIIIFIILFLNDESIVLLAAVAVGFVVGYDDLLSDKTNMSKKQSYNETPQYSNRYISDKPILYNIPNATLTNELKKESSNQLKESSNELKKESSNELKDNCNPEMPKESFTRHKNEFDIQLFNDPDITKVYKDMGSSADTQIANRMKYMALQPKMSMDIRSRHNRYSLLPFFDEELKANENRDWWDVESDFLDEYM